MEYATLDGYIVSIVTERAIAVRKQADVSADVQWIPKSQVQDGSEIVKHDTDIAVAKWFADKEGLDY